MLQVVQPDIGDSLRHDYETGSSFMRLSGKVAWGGGAVGK